MSLKPYYDHAGITIYHGDCLEILPELEPVDAVVTDPPYGMDWNTDISRFSGETDGAGSLASELKSGLRLRPRARARARDVNPGAGVIMPPTDKPHGPPPHAKHAIDVGARFTVSAIDNGFFTRQDGPETIADYFLAITKRIIDTPIDGDKP